MKMDEIFSMLKLSNIGIVETYRSFKERGMNVTFLAPTATRENRGRTEIVD